MERMPIPTSPANRQQWVHHTPRRTGWLVLTLLLSLAAGFCGSLVLRVFQFDVFQTTAPDIVVLPNTGSNGSVGFVRAIQTNQAESIVQLWVEERWIGNGIILSNDGWIVTAAPLTEDAAVTVETSTGKVYTNDRLQMDGERLISYVHVPSTGLHPATFRETDLQLGETILAYSLTTDLERVAFANIATVQTDILLDRVLESHYIGAPLYDSNQALVGFATATDQIIPITAVNVVAYELFSTGEIE